MNDRARMKLQVAGIVLSLALVRAANAQCLPTFTLSTNSCSYDTLVSSLQNTALNGISCAHSAEKELQLSLAASTTEEVKEIVAKACSAAYIPFGAITDEGHNFDEAYFDGGTYYNDEREDKTDHGIVINRLKNDPGARIRDIQHNIAQSNGFTWPDYMSNFKDCEVNAAMCCFVQDRQAGDGNGNCAAPYSEDCVDADPADNTDICYVDMERAPTSSRTESGYAIFEGEKEGDSHCHGFAWAEDPTDESARFIGNNLFFVSLYDHFTQRGYVTNTPGAPMCGCLEQMPVVTRSDCTQIDIVNEDVEFSFSATEGFSANVTNLEIEFNSCQGANNNNNDLEAYYERLVNEKKISQTLKDEFDKHVVGETYCREAIDSFLDTQGVMAKPQCKYGYPEECGCAEVEQSDYRGTISKTEGDEYECQRWDSQEPHRHSRTRSNYPDSGLNENYCRNPDGEDRAWCYTTDPEVRWRFCTVPTCGVEPTPAPTPPPNCYKNPEECGCAELIQIDYRGDINVTKSGKTCQRWDSQYPHEHTRTPSRYSNAGLDENYCRNPDGEDEGAWCYTTDNSTRWEYCNVPTCGVDDVGGTTRKLRGA